MLGYELVGAELILDFHSWHCHGYADDAKDQVGIELNALGLIVTYDDAARLLRWMFELPPAEQPKPVPWTVVALVRP